MQTVWKHYLLCNDVKSQRQNVCGPKKFWEQEPDLDMDYRYQCNHDNLAAKDTFIFGNSQSSIEDLRKYLEVLSTKKSNLELSEDEGWSDSGRSKLCKHFH